MPIGRIATSGPDTAPKKYADQSLGATWFTAKTPAQSSGDPKPAEAAQASPETGAAERPVDAGDDAGTGLVIDLDLTGILAGNAPGPDAAGSNARDMAIDTGPTLPMRRSKKSQAAPAQRAPSTGQAASDAAATAQATPPTAAPQGGPASATAPEGQPAPASSPQAQPAVAPLAQPTPSIPPQGQPASLVPPQDAATLKTLPRSSTPLATPSRNGTVPAAPPGPPEGTAAGRAGAAGQQWAARDEAEDNPPAPDQEPAEANAPLRPIKPLPADDLAAIRWRLDGGTLREVVDDREALRDLGLRLDEPLADEPDNVTRAGLLCVRAEVYRLLEELGMAAAASRLALAHAESAGDVQAIVIAQAELAHVLRLRGDYAEADRLFEEAASSEAPEELRSIVHENAGRSCFDQGRHMEALDHFARSVRLGRPDDTDLIERIDVSLEAVYIHALRDGWGPYPRLRWEILGMRTS